MTDSSSLNDRTYTDAGRATSTPFDDSTAVIVASRLVQEVDADYRRLLRRHPTSGPALAGTGAVAARWSAQSGPASAAGGPGASLAGLGGSAAWPPYDPHGPVLDHDPPPKRRDTEESVSAPRGMGMGKGGRHLTDRY
ncbi:MAG: hypothetical protein M0Z95_15710, partial [Actinomycetota bacterium]|nr:hypothetical protein [Actinomycetota bacterium]